VIDSSFELLKRLKELGYIKKEKDPFWWPNSGSFEVVIGAILTQNSRWERVEEALINLKSFIKELNLKNIASIDQQLLASLIKPVGFYNTKAFRLKRLSLNILNEFGSFENFQKRVSREWLLDQKGVGKESADSILNYACYKDFMVVDNYTFKILYILGYEFYEYEDAANFLTEGVFQNLDEIHRLYGKKMDLNQIYARFHGKIVEFCKENFKGKDKERRVKELLLG